MALESSIILRSVLLHTMKAKTLKEAVDDTKALCSKEDIDAVMEAFREWQKDNGIIVENK